MVHGGFKVFLNQQTALYKYSKIKITFYHKSYNNQGTYLFFIVHIFA